MTVKFSVLYPKTEGATFDREYYVNTHVPLAVTTVAGARSSSAKSAHLSPCCQSVTGSVMVPS